MRILVDGRYIQDHFPGIGRYTYNLVRALPEMAPEVEWLVLLNPALRNTRYDLSSLARLPGLRVVNTAVATFSLSEQTALPALASRLGVDLWHAPYYVMPYRLPCPSVLTFHDAIAHYFPATLTSPWKRPVFELLIRLAVRSAARFAATSQASRDDLVRFYGVDAGCITVTPEAADERFAPQPDDVVRAAVDRLGLPWPYALYLASNKPHKNLVRLVRAWHALVTSGRAAGARLVIAGHWDPHFPQARELAERLGLGGAVHFAGPIPEADLPVVLAGARVFIFPSLYEGFGLPVLEAMACGTPVICSNRSSLPEVAGDAGVLVDPEDVSAIASALDQVLGDANLRENLRKRGVDRAATFTWKRSAALTLAVYRAALGVD
jgi:glycosyltransferase involved in cell wall biosynthesis